MSDTLKIFGSEYVGVTGIIAKDNNSTDKAYVRPQGTKSITQNGTGIDVTSYASVDVSVPSGQPTLQTKSVSYTPSETAQSETVSADSGYDGLDEVSVSVGAISSTYVGSGITRRTSQDMQYGANYSIIAPSGYYPDSASVSIPFYAHLEPYITVNDSTGLVEASHTVVPDAIITGNAVTRSYIQLTVGNNLEYGLTDGTLPLVGVAKVGSAQI